MDRSKALLRSAVRLAALSDGRSLSWSARHTSGPFAPNDGFRSCNAVTSAQFVRFDRLELDCMNLRANVLILVQDDLSALQVHRGAELTREVYRPVIDAYLRRFSEMAPVPGVTERVAVVSASLVASCSLIVAATDVCDQRRAYLESGSNAALVKNVVASASFGRMIVGIERCAPKRLLIV